LPLGFNQGGVRVKPYDFTSLIALTLGSNLYLSGLAQMDYMEMNEKLIPFPKVQDNNVKAGEIFVNSSQMIHLNSSDRN